jgi:hypothetical protein
MCGRLPPLLLLALVGCATARGALAPDGSVSTEAAPLELPGPFRGEQFRYERMDAPVRVLHDIVAIPAGVTGWTGSDWAQLGLWTAGIGALMIPAPRSADSLLDGWFRRELDPILPTVWTDPMQATLWSSLAVAGLGGWWWADHSGRSHLAQGLSLMGESLAVAQAYHVGLKLLIGREGPRPDGAEPQTYGPGVGFRLYPSGAPSGHATTLYSLMSAGFAWFEPPGWVQVTGHVALFSLLTFHAIDHRHYASDLLWGGAMGWYVGQWVVKHRGSRPAADARAARPAVQAAVVPVPLPGGAGAAVVVGY